MPMAEELQKKATSVSSPHTLLDIQGTIRIRDLNSLNGTIVQGRSLQPGVWAVVRDGWTIQAGDICFKVRTNVAGLPDLIANRYQVRSWMGGGGMANVFVVFDTDDGVERALKVICSLHGSHDEQQRQLYLEAFTFEMSRSQAIRHPNFVQVRGVGDDPAVGPYMVMDLINGPSVEQLIVQTQRLRPQDAVEIATQAGDALQHLHVASHLVHCDVAPKNLLVDQTGVVYVSDLGIAMGEGERDPDFYSDGYMAPELFRGEPATPAADVYSLGVSLYEMMTGERYQTAAGGAGPAGVPQASSLPIPDPRKVLLTQQQVADPLPDVVLRALHDDPSQRYAQMQEFLAALAPFNKGADLQGLVGWWVSPPQPPAPPAPSPSSTPAAASTSPPAAGTGNPQSPTNPVASSPAPASGAPQPIGLSVPDPSASEGSPSTPAPAKVHCPNCGYANRPGAKFCGRCRKVLTPAQGTPPLSTLCPGCGKPVKAGAIYCGSCGRKIT